MDSPAASHLRIEAVKLAYADRDRYIADPEMAAVPTAQLLSKDYAQGRAALIQPAKARKSPAPGALPFGTDTVYLTTADAHGNVVSFINSLFFPFGSGMVVPGTGIALHNRGFGFSLDAAHRNCIAPGKRPFHTIIPAMLFKDGAPLVSFGIMGGDMQAQAHVQFVSNLVDFDCNVQEALDRPRFHYLDTDRVALERDLARSAGEELRRMGHVIEDELAALAARRLRRRAGDRRRSRDGRLLGRLGLPQRRLRDRLLTGRTPARLHVHTSTRPHVRTSSPLRSGWPPRTGRADCARARAERAGGVWPFKESANGAEAALRRFFRSSSPRSGRRTVHGIAVAH